MRTKKILPGLFGLGVLFLILAYGPGPSSAGAPASHTGAPEEENCSESGCHDDNQVNFGSAILNMELGTSTEKLTAGKTYLLKVTIKDENVSRFGFQVLALDSKTQENCGEFLITDSLRTQIVHNRYKFFDRKYVTYTFNGTDAVERGKGEWTFLWKAPDHLNSSVNFYLSGVSANDDMSDKGDFVYTKIINFN